MKKNRYKQDKKWNIDEPSSFLEKAVYAILVVVMLIMLYISTIGLLVIMN